jgi:hypothetical protein
MPVTAVLHNGVKGCLEGELQTNGKFGYPGYVSVRIILCVFGDEGAVQLSTRAFAGLSKFSPSHCNAPYWGAP